MKATVLTYASESIQNYSGDVDFSQVEWRAFASAYYRITLSHKGVTLTHKGHADNTIYTTSHYRHIIIGAAYAIPDLVGDCRAFGNGTYALTYGPPRNSFYYPIPLQEDE